VDDYAVDTLINTGVAGSLDAQIDIGDIVLSSAAQQHDMDASALGDPVGIIPRMEESVFPADAQLVAAAKAACEQANPDIHCFVGKVLSGDQFIASAEKKDYLIQTFDGMCAEMEGGAMAQVAYLNQVPYLVIRAISDKADNSGQEDYPVFAKKAIVHSVQLLEELYKSF
jgi:adenosylhomocysteine nucleosidase